MDAEKKVGLEAFAEACAALANVFERRAGEQRFAASFAERAEAANRLRSTPFTQHDIDAVAGALPIVPDWLRPKWRDAGIQADRQQQQAAALHDRIRRLALDLRTVEERHG